ncbi:AraC family transcriptional regulator [Mesorhizobium sp. M0074]|uniref:AraC family transcriptional regulator n=1 Tax=Mesorhizobium sp. M0074 TaxID=2956869 RepID=UPI00333BB509
MNTHTSIYSKATSQREYSVEAMTLLDDVRRAIGRNREAGRVAALRLVTLFTLPTTAESALVRGGLAPWQMRKLDHYLREHLERPLRLEKLAEQVRLSVSHFCHTFRESFGTSPHVHITRLRLELAQRLMLSTDDPLSQIALECGLSDQAHLSKLFRRELGDTPGAWRRRNLTDGQAETSRPHPIGSQSAGAA